MRGKIRIIITHDYDDDYKYSIGLEKTKERLK